MDNKEVWQKLYPNKPYQDATFRRLSSDLNQMALRFLSAEARSQNPLAEALDLQRLLEKPELKKHLAGIERNITRLLEEVPGQSTEFYLAQFNLHNNIVNKASKHLSAAGFAEKLYNTDFFLECFYLTQKLKIYVAWLLFQGSRTTEKHIELPPSFWENLENERFKDIPLLIIYRQIVYCLTEPEEELHFKNFQFVLSKNKEALAKEDLREIYQITQNYCALKINQGQTVYYQDAFLIYKDMIERDLLLQKDQLSEGIFKNIVTASLRIGEFDWAENFINAYAIYLPANHQENARTFNLANLYSHQKKHYKVIELLQNVEYSDVVYSLSTKIILVRTYYELGEDLALDSLLDSFKIFLRRNKLISKSQKREYLNFLNFVKNLTIIDTSDTRKLAKLRVRIENASSITPKKWLLEKMDLISNRTKK
jgi:hypothetical protein